MRTSRRKMLKRKTSRRKTSRKTLKKRTSKRKFGTMDRRTLHEINYTNDTRGYTDIDGILLAPDAFGFENSPQDRALNAGM